MGRRIVTAALAVAVVVGLVGCEPAPPETLPGPHGSGRTPARLRLRRLAHAGGRLPGAGGRCPATSWCRRRPAARGCAAATRSRRATRPAGGPGSCRRITEVQPDYLILAVPGVGQLPAALRRPARAVPYTAPDPGSGLAGVPPDVRRRRRRRRRAHPHRRRRVPVGPGQQARLDRAHGDHGRRRPAPWPPACPTTSPSCPIRQDLTRNGAYTTFTPCKPYDEGYTQPKVTCWEPVPSPRLARGRGPPAGRRPDPPLVPDRRGHVHHLDPGRAPDPPLGLHRPQRPRAGRTADA